MRIGTLYLFLKTTVFFPINPWIEKYHMNYKTAWVSAISGSKTNISPCVIVPPLGITQENKMHILRRQSFVFKCVVATHILLTIVVV